MKTGRRSLLERACSPSVGPGEELPIAQTSCELRLMVSEIMSVLAAWAMGTIGTIACFAIGWLVVRWWEARKW